MVSSAILGLYLKTGHNAPVRIRSYLNRTFSGTIVLVDRNTPKGAGCLVGRILCKSRVLVRIG
jgi:hypothetical protein